MVCNEMTSKKTAAAKVTTRAEPSIVQVGHPFSTTGMGEQMRACYSALRAAEYESGMVDIYRYSERSDPDHAKVWSGQEFPKLPSGVIRIFHINGNEVEPCLSHLEAGGSRFSEGYNIIVPAWELPRYPAAWAKQLKKFNEVWAISKYVLDILQAAGIDAHYVGQSVEIAPRAFLPRRHFSLSESAFVLLHFFDTSSFAARKNPTAVVELFKKFRRKLPFANVQLVLKVKHGDETSPEWAKRLKDEVPDALVLSSRMNTYELHSLIAASDCFVSLHRAEGFGRGTGEAMCFGRLAMGTGWSGNVDYMTKSNSLFVNCTPVAVKKNEYPHWTKQVWAEPDVDHALHLLRKAFMNPTWSSEIARKGQSDVMRTMGHRAVGLRMATRIRAIESERIS